MQQVEVRRRIAGTPEDVFAAYTDHASWGEWAGVGPARLAREGVPAPNGVGCVRVLGPRFAAAHEEIVSFDAPRRMTYRLVKGVPLLRGHFGEVDFSPAGSGTLVVGAAASSPASQASAGSCGARLPACSGERSRAWRGTASRSDEALAA